MTKKEILNKKLNKAQTMLINAKGYSLYACLVRQVATQRINLLRRELSICHCDECRDAGCARY